MSVLLGDLAAIITGIPLEEMYRTRSRIITTAEMLVTGPLPPVKARMIAEFVFSADPELERNPEEMEEMERAALEFIDMLLDEVEAITIDLLIVKGIHWLSDRYQIRTSLTQ